MKDGASSASTLHPTAAIRSPEDSFPELLLLRHALVFFSSRFFFVFVLAKQKNKSLPTHQVK